MVLAAVAVVVVLMMFSAADHRVPVLQLVHDVTAGEQVSASDFRVLSVSADASLPTVGAGQLGVVVGEYARVRMVSGSLLAFTMLQPAPLVAPGSAVVSVTLSAGGLPAGMRERSQVQVVFVAAAGAAPVGPVVGRVVGVPVAPDSVTGSLSVSLELSAVDATTVAAWSGTARLVLLDPGVDPAISPAPPVSTSVVSG